MYLQPEPASIRRHFATVKGRQVHYRRAGSGPPLVVLHQSPTSSAEMASHIAAFSRHFTVIAPDTPGYGLSDPLPLAQPEMHDYADALAELLDVLQIDACGIYGTHTGAMIAAEFARRHPGRVSTAVLDGYVVLSDAERSALLANYFIDVAPRRDGGHLAWYWSRIRDQVLFFPWYDQRREARMRFDVPPAEALQPYVLDLLRADRMGTPAYAAAFRYPASKRITEFTAATWLLNYAQDAIADHPERLEHLPDCVHRELLADPDALMARAIELFTDAAQGLLEPPPAPASPPAVNAVDYIDTPLGPILVRRQGASDAAPMILLHAPGMSSREWQALPAGFTAAASLLAADLPGHGESPAAMPEDAGVLLDALEAVVDAAGPDARVLALNESAWLALALRARRPSLAVILVDMPMPRDEAQPLRLAPDLAPCDHGGHLLAAWQCVRDAELFRPWHRPWLAHALEHDFELEPVRIHARTLELLKAAPTLSAWTSLLGGLDVQALLSVEGTPPLIVARLGRGAEDDADHAATLAGGSALRWPAALADWHAGLLARP
ncbi:MAG: alpha/beta hydrolase [Gammaproteobacteria bacterium]|nr:alpha/beta hydrolase [Gammaproteobacteria bacterium]